MELGKAIINESRGENASGTSHLLYAKFAWSPGQCIQKACEILRDACPAYPASLIREREEEQQTQMSVSVKVLMEN